MTIHLPSDPDEPDCHHARIELSNEGYDNLNYIDLTLHLEYDDGEVQRVTHSVPLSGLWAAVMALEEQRKAYE